MIPDEQVLDMARQFWSMSDRMQQIIRHDFPGVDIRYAGTTVTDEHDVHFYIRCKGGKIRDPLMFAIHILSSGGGYVIFADVVEEGSGAMWWRCDQMRCGAEGLETHF